MVQVKICGLTRLEDALAAVELGADMLGFNFYPASPRYIDPVACARLVVDLLRKLGEKASRVALVGVYVNTDPGQVTAVMDDCGLALAQLSGDEPPSDLQQIGPRAYKALRPANEKVFIQAAGPYLTRTQPPALLLDAYVPGEYGGTGRQADWNLAHQVARSYPILLAGGLNPDNVSAAVLRTRPWGVDVASGIEIQPGRKDYRQMQAFMRAVRAVEDEIR